MNRTHDTISALLDNEPFNPEELLEALSDPAGRALLIDLATLRQIVQPSEPVPPIAAGSPVGPRRWQLVAAAAAVLVALAGGYAVGTRQAIAPSTAAPSPTRIVEAVPFTPTGGTP
jgi:hypothetical protein